MTVTNMATGRPKPVMSAARKPKARHKVSSSSIRPTRPVDLTVLRRVLMYLDMSLWKPTSTPGGRLACNSSPMRRTVRATLMVDASRVFERLRLIDGRPLKRA